MWWHVMAMMTCGSVTPWTQLPSALPRALLIGWGVSGDVYPPTQPFWLTLWFEVFELCFSALSPQTLPVTLSLISRLQHLMSKVLHFLLHTPHLSHCPTHMLLMGYSGWLPDPLPRQVVFTSLGPSVTCYTCLYCANLGLAPSGLPMASPIALL